MIFIAIAKYFVLNMFLTALIGIGIAIYRHWNKNQAGFYFWITFISIGITFGFQIIALFLAIMAKELIIFSYDELGRIPPEYWPPHGYH